MQWAHFYVSKPQLCWGNCFVVICDRRHYDVQSNYIYFLYMLYNWVAKQILKWELKQQKITWKVKKTLDGSCWGRSAQSWDSRYSITTGRKWVPVSSQWKELVAASTAKNTFILSSTWSDLIYIFTVHDIWHRFTLPGNQSCP